VVEVPPILSSSKERATLIARYQQGYQAVLDALAGSTDAELDARPAPGEWTAREVVHHLADSEMTSAIRLRRLLVEDDPVIGGYDEMAFARVLHYANRPIQPALDALAAARSTTAQLFENMTDADWSRRGTHTESGAYSATDWLHIYADHAHDHAEQIRRARASAQPRRA
jgi:hypothetical protein